MSNPLQMKAVGMMGLGRMGKTGHSYITPSPMSHVVREDVTIAMELATHRQLHALGRRWIFGFDQPPLAVIQVCLSSVPAQAGFTVIAASLFLLPILNLCRLVWETEEPVYLCDTLKLYSCEFSVILRVFHVTLSCAG